jgi:hypothetical protein
MQNITKPVVASTMLRSGAADEFLQAMFRTEQIMNAINFLIAPELYGAGQETLQGLAMLPEPIPSSVRKWPSVASGLAIVVNRTTRMHKDVNGMNACYDLLMTAGEYDNCYLELEDLNMKLRYLPGSVVALCGRIFEHGVNDWTGGNRVCISHYFRKNVFNRMKTKIPGYVELSHFSKFMDPAYMLQV